MHILQINRPDKYETEPRSGNSSLHQHRPADVCYFTALCGTGWILVRIKSIMHSEAAHAASRWLLLILFPLALSVSITAAHIYSPRLICGFSLLVSLSRSLCSDFYQLLKATIPTSPCSFLSVISSKFLSPDHIHKLSPLCVCPLRSCRLI